MLSLLHNHISPRVLHTVLLLFCLFFFIPSLACAEEWIYVVQPGDDLWSLSKKYLTSSKLVGKLQKINKITNPSHLIPGTKLRFPVEMLKTGATVARVSHINGQVTMTCGETSTVKPVTKGTILWEKDTIRTGPGSTVNLEFSDGSIVQLQSNSTLQLMVLRTYGETGMSDTRIKLLRGRTRNKVIPKSGPASRFEITTPSAAAAVRGTEYRVRVGDDKSSTVEVLRGMVDLGSRGVARELPGGYGSVAFRDRPPLPAIELLPPPDIHDLPVTLTTKPPVITFGHLQAATAYRLQIARDTAFTALIHEVISKTEQVTLPSLPDGNYFLRIRGIDDHGIEGRESTRGFTLASLPQPPSLLRPNQEAIIDTSRPIFQWSAQPQAEAYLVQLAATPNFSKPLIKSRTETTSYQPQEPLPVGRYYWRTASLQNGKIGPFSAALSFSHPPEAPDLTHSRLEEGVLSWKNMGQDKSYRIQIAKESTFTDPIRDDRVNVPRYGFQDLGYGEFYVRVAAIAPATWKGLSARRTR